MMKNPQITVCVVTYNHEKYVRQCLQSIVDQNINVDIEVVVCDDCSTDNTRAIIAEFSRKYPSIIKPVLLDKNIGAYRNFIQIHNRATGEFVSHCDGDDYFFPGKLQAQYDYLVSHPDCSVTWHHMQIVQGEQMYCFRNPSFFLDDGRIELPMLLRMGSIGLHSSVMYRRSARVTKDEDLKLLDYYYALEFLQSGYGHFIKDIYGAYRRFPTGGSMTSSRAGYIRVKKLLAQHYTDFLARNKRYRCDVFVGVLFDFLYDAAMLRKSCFEFLPVLLKSFSFLSIPAVFKVLRIKILLLERVEIQ